LDDSAAYIVHEIRNVDLQCVSFIVVHITAAVMVYPSRCRYLAHFYLTTWCHSRSLGPLPWETFKWNM